MSYRLQPTAPIDMHRYIMQVNELDETKAEDSATFAVIKMTSNRPRQRRVWMCKFLKQNYNLTRAQAFKTIKLMEFNDISCGNSSITRYQ